MQNLYLQLTFFTDLETKFGPSEHFFAMPDHIHDRFRFNLKILKTTEYNAALMNVFYTFLGIILLNHSE